MTTRKPIGVTFESHVEEQIRAAMERGDFAGLPGAGRPLSNLDDDDPMWWIKQKARAEGLDLPAPEQLRLRSDVASRLAEVVSMRSEAQVRAAVDELNRRIAAFNAHHLDGPPTDLGLVDVDRVIARWKVSPR